MYCFSGGSEGVNNVKFFSRVATKSNSTYNMMNGVRATQSFPHNILRMKCLIYIKLGTHMPGGERRKPIDIEDRRTKVKVTTSKNRKKKILFSFPNDILTLFMRIPYIYGMNNVALTADPVHKRVGSNFTSFMFRTSLQQLFQ
jgi:hypothetical protein